MLSDVSPAERKLLLYTVLAAAALRVGLLFGWHTYVVEDPKGLGIDWAFGYETGRIARALAEGEGFSSPFRGPSGPTAWLMPVYPWLLSLIFRVLGVYSMASAVAILAFNGLVSALTCIPVFLVARTAFGRTPAAIAAVGWAIYPPSIWHAIRTFWDTSLLALCAAAVVYAAYRLERRDDRPAFFACGVLVGLSALVGVVILAYLPYLWLAIVSRRGRTRSWKAQAIAALTAGTVLVLSPWLLRNRLEFDRLFLRSNLGVELRLGNSPRAWDDFETTGLLTEPWFLGHPAVVPQEFERYVALGEVGYVDRDSRIATTFIRESPGKFLQLTLRRIEFYWLADPGSRNQWHDGLHGLPWIRRLCRYLLPLAFAVLGAVLALKRRLPVWPMLALLALLPSIYYVTHVSERYRIPVEPVIVVLASYGLCEVVRTVRTWFGAPERIAA
jgi:4-amino-4-deoxy-L-arabinose transferase-like glycosyltransferase